MARRPSRQTSSRDRATPGLIGRRLRRGAGRAVPRWPRRAAGRARRGARAYGTGDRQLASHGALGAIAIGPEHLGRGVVLGGQQHLGRLFGDLAGDGVHATDQEPGGVGTLRSRAQPARRSWPTASPARRTPASVVGPARASRHRSSCRVSAVTGRADRFDRQQERIRRRSRAPRSTRRSVLPLVSPLRHRPTTRPRVEMDVARAPALPPGPQRPCQATIRTRPSIGVLGDGRARGRLRRSGDRVVARPVIATACGTRRTGSPAAAMAALTVADGSGCRRWKMEAARTASAPAVTHRRHEIVREPAAPPDAITGTSTCELIARRSAVSKP